MAATNKFLSVLKKAKRPMSHRRIRARLRALTAPPWLALAAQLAEVPGQAVTADWNGIWRPAHGCRACWWPRHRASCRARAARNVAAMMGGAGRSLPSRRRRDRHERASEADTLTVYNRQPRGCGRPKNSAPTVILAGCDLCGEVRHLCEHRRPRADDQPRRPSRRAGMRARTGRYFARCRMRSGHKLPFDSLRQLRANLYEQHPHLARHRPDRAR